jgi:hypothetical protein
MPLQIRTTLNVRTERRRLVNGHWVRPQHRTNPAEMPQVLRDALVEVRERAPERQLAQLV